MSKYTKKEYRKYCRVTEYPSSYKRWLELQPIFDEIQDDVISKTNKIVT